MAAVTIDQLVKDARSGVRVVRRDPCATAVAVLSNLCKKKGSRQSDGFLVTDMMCDHV
jgi:hypothetical protein